MGGETSRMGNVVLLPPALRCEGTSPLLISHRHLVGAYESVFGKQNSLDRLFGDYVSNRNAPATIFLDLLSGDRCSRIKQTVWAASATIKSGSLLSASNAVNEGNLSLFVESPCNDTWNFFSAQKMEWNTSTALKLNAGFVHRCGVGVHVLVDNEDFAINNGRTYLGMSYDSQHFRTDVFANTETNIARIGSVLSIVENITAGWDATVDIAKRSVRWTAGVRLKRNEKSNEYVEVRLKDSANRIEVGFFQRAQILRRVFNPFEAEDVTGIFNYVDFGIRLNCDLRQHQQLSAVQNSFVRTPPSFSIAASNQINKNLLLKLLVDDEGPKAVVAFKSHQTPSVGAACTFGPGLFGITVSIENSPERPRYEIPSAESVMNGRVFKGNIRLRREDGEPWNGD